MIFILKLLRLAKNMNDYLHLMVPKIVYNLLKKKMQTILETYLRLFR